VALVLSPDGTEMLAIDKTAKDFVSDAFAHCKFIGYTEEALPLIERAGVRPEDMDEGLIALSDAKSVTGFLETIGQLRLWDRELKIDLDAAGFLAAQS